MMDKKEPVMEKEIHIGLVVDNFDDFACDVSNLILVLSKLNAKLDESTKAYKKFYKWQQKVMGGVKE